MHPNAASNSGRCRTLAAAFTRVAGDRWVTSCTSVAGEWAAKLDVIRPFPVLGLKRWGGGGDIEMVKHLVNGTIAP